jgi:hypothetical protein
MKSILLSMCIVLTLFATSFMACKKNGLNSASAKKIQYRWQNISSSSATDYLDGRPLIWTVRQASPGIYTQFDNDGYMYRTTPSFTEKYVYKVDGDKILYLGVTGSRPTTPKYTDTSFIKYVDNSLLVLSSRKYFSSGAYAYLDQRIDSLKK